MSTFLFNETIFGPVVSRRLGLSLGINLLPDNAKICSFNCVYCECGWTDSSHSNNHFPSREKVKNNLEDRLKQLAANNDELDAITFAGNGEPTLHPDFPGIIDDVIDLRDKFFKKADVVVLSNATFLHKASVIEALLKVDKNILKLDAGTEDMISLINQPFGNFKLSELIENLKKFNGNIIIQSLFLRGEINGKVIDNTTENEITLWIQYLKEIQPKEVMIYSLDREAPATGLQKVGSAELEKIADQLRENALKVIAY